MMVYKFNRIVWFFVLEMLMGCVTTSFAQSLAERNWYFGSPAKGIRFNRPDFQPTVTNPGISLGTGGGAVATDANTGNVLFYTDGNIVYDASDTPMVNGGLGGSNALNQSSVICPVPGTPNQYYVFTITAAGNLRQAIVDMSLFGNATFPSTTPLGDVIPASKVNVGLANRSEAMTIIPNGNDFWLITQNATTKEYTLTSITSLGVGSLPPVSLGVPLTAANFSFFDNGNGTGKIAVSPKDALKNVTILDFDKVSGALTLDPALNNYLFNTGVTNAPTEAIYDTEWSVTGDTLYISQHGDGATVPPNVLQIVLTGPVTPPTSILPPPPSLDITKSYGLQKGPDGAIYHLYEDSAGKIHLGKITDNDGTGTSQVGYTEMFPSINFFNAKQFSSTSLPAQTNYTITFSSLGSCTNSPITFIPTVTPGADSIVWNFGDSSPAVTSWSPFYTYTTAPTNPVVATAYLNGVAVANTSQPLSLTNFNLQLTLQSDTTACSCELKFPKAVNPPPPCTPFVISPQSSGGSSPTYQWYGPSGLLPGKTSLALNGLDSAGYYYVKATDSNGCSVTAGQNVNEYHVQDQRANSWFFGDNAGIDFNPLFYTPPKNGPAVPISGPVNSTEGVAVISDRNGKTVLSTDGQQVYDRAGNPLIAGVISPVSQQSTQSALIMPVPGDETLYYIFTTDAAETSTNSLSYMVFDLKIGTNGGLVNPSNAPDPSVVLFSKSTEQLTGNSDWLIAHEYGSDAFRAYNVTTTGISAPVISEIGSVHSTTTPSSAQGYIKLGPRNLLAVALNDGTSSAFELFDFVDSTGAVTNYRSISVPVASGEELYGLEFSPGGNKLYATAKGASGSTIHEYSIDSLGVIKEIGSGTSVPEVLGSLQTGPDGEIYIAANGKPYLLHFTPDDNILPTPVATTGLASLQQFDLKGNTSTLGLPNFIQNLGNPAQSPGMNAPFEACPNVPVSFSATPSDQYRDDFTWVIRDQSGAFVTSSTQESFQYTFTTPGTYKISLDITSKCSYPSNLVGRFTQNLVINAPPSNPTFLLPLDNNILCGPSKQLRATPNPTDLSFLWTTTETTNDITVTQSGSYGVTITDDITGCTSTGSINIVDNRPVVDLGPDFPLCTNGSKSLNAGNPGSTYSWEIDGTPVLNSNQQLFPVNTSAMPGVHIYKVAVTNTSCSASDEVSVTLNAIPTFTNNILANPNCGFNTGQIRVDITSPGTSLYKVDFSGPSVNDVKPNQSSGQILPVYQNLSAGTYNVIVTNNFTNCDAQDAVGLSNTGFTVTPTFASPTCNPVGGTLNITGGTPPYQYSFTNTATGIATPFAVYNGILTTSIVPGSYVVEVRDASPTPCVTTAPINIVSKPLVDFILSQACDQVTATPVNIPPPVTNATYTWSDQNGPLSATTNILTVAPGTWTISVTVDDPADNLCESTQSIPIVVNNNITPDFTYNVCVNPAILSATPVSTVTDTYIYSWDSSPVGANTPTNIGSGQQITINATADYTLRVSSNSSGCNLGSVTHTVLFEPVIIALTSTLPCQGQEFTITATPTPSSNILPPIQWFRNGQLLSQSTATTIQATASGIYKATTTVNTCPITANINVNALPFDPAVLPGIAYICDDPDNNDEETNQITLDPGAGFESYTWFKDRNNLNTNTPTFVVTELGMYAVNVTNVFGCSDTTETKILRDCRPRITGPNAFRPGGLNTDFFLYTFFISDEDFQIFIFNRWGEMVYQSNDRAFRWNGTYKGVGAALPAGMFAWVVKYKSSYNPKGIQEQRGGVMLMR